MLSLLRSHRVTSDCPLEVLQKIADRLRPYNYEEGAYVIQLNEECASLHLLLNGQARQA